MILQTQPFVLTDSKESASVRGRRRRMRRMISASQKRCQGVFIKVYKFSQLFMDMITDQIDTLSDRKLGEVLGVGNIFDAQQVKDEIKESMELSS